MASILAEIVVLEVKRTKVAASFRQPGATVEGTRASFAAVLLGVCMSAGQPAQTLPVFGASSSMECLDELARLLTGLKRLVGRIGLELSSLLLADGGGAGAVSRSSSNDRYWTLSKH